MTRSVIRPAVTSLGRILHRQIRAVTIAAFLCTTLSLVAVGLAVLWSPGSLQDRGVLLILGSNVALTPFVLGRALEQALKDA